MRVTLYTTLAFERNGCDFTGILVDAELSDMDSAPTVLSVHNAMPEYLLTTLGINPASEYEAEGVVIHAVNELDWSWFRHEHSSFRDDPTNWTISQLFEFNQILDDMDLRGDQWETFGIFLDNYWNVGSQGTDQLRESYESAYQGSYDTSREYAEYLYSELNDGTTDLSVWPFTCIDWDDAARELEIGGDVSYYERENGGIAVYNNSF